MKKMCTCCSALKELEYFYNNKNSKDGLTHNCKSCMDDKRNKWLSKNRSKEAARVKKYREKTLRKLPILLKRHTRKIKINIICKKENTEVKIKKLSMLGIEIIRNKIRAL